MNPEQLAGELGLPGAQEVLRDSAIARLAYNGPDGFPRVIPCGFWWTGTAIVICTAPTAPKTTALAARPEVAITIDTSGPGGERSLLLRGSAVLDTVDGVAEEYLAAAAKTMSESDLAGFEHAVRATYDQMVRISITPQWARFFDFGAGRLPKFLTELVAKSAG
jgi:nitroimidazol reductase NimA-like FMN-containing flavoprotein (pyridoxamine 5'-phosphate oxidase superfamily)